MNWGWTGLGLVWGDLGLKDCTEFVFPECWRFDNGASSKIDDVLAEDGGLLQVLPFAVTVFVKASLSTLEYLNQH